MNHSEQPSSDHAGPLGMLVADAGDLLTEIEILDSRLEPVPLAANLGRAEAKLAPGICEVRFRAGPHGPMRSQDIALFGGGSAQPVTLEQPLEFASAVPFKGTSTWNERHHNEALQIGQGSPHFSLGGGGGRLLLFVRDSKSELDVDPVRGLSLHDLDGDWILDFSDVATRSQDGHCAGCLLEFPPGEYRLRLSMGKDEAFERIVPLARDWMTQLFFFARTHGGDPHKRFADFWTSALALTPLEIPFALDATLWRSPELARHALDGDRARLGEQSLDVLAAQAPQSPWLALCAAHLHLRCPHPDGRRLEGLLARIPPVWREQADFRILRALVDLLKGGTLTDDRPIDSPPALFASWNGLLRMSESAAHLVRPYSVVDDIAGQGRRAGPWFAWGGSHERPPIPSGQLGQPFVEPASMPSEGRSLSELSEAMGFLVTELQQSPPLMARLATEDLSSLERRVAHMAVSIALPGLREDIPQDNPQYKQLWQLMTWAPSPEQLQQNLSVPVTTAWRGLQSLLDKLGVNVRFLRLQDLVKTGAVDAALRRCHTACRGLIAFEDFSQEVLLRAVEKQETFRGQTDAELLGWLQAIGAQQMATHLRRAKGKEVRPLPVDVPDSRAQSPLEHAAAREELRPETDDERLRRVMSTISPEERMLLNRLYLGNEKLLDVAKELGVPPNTLAQRHARLLRRLRKDKI